jgi:hypothetical protein
LPAANISNGGGEIANQKSPRRNDESNRRGEMKNQIRHGEMKNQNRRGGEN